MKIQSPKFRIFAGFFMLASIVFGYWWLTWTLAIVFLFVFPLYYEIIAWGIIYDALYGISLAQFYNIPSMFSLASVILFVIALYLRKYLLAYI